MKHVQSTAKGSNSVNGKLHMPQRPHRHRVGSQQRGTSGRNNREGRHIVTQGAPGDADDEIAYFVEQVLVTQDVRGRALSYNLVPRTQHNQSPFAVAHERRVLSRDQQRLTDIHAGVLRSHCNKKASSSRTVCILLPC